jgi:hypothetical protein
MNEAQFFDISQPPADVQTQLDEYLAAIESAEQRMKKDDDEIEFLRTATRETLKRINLILNHVEGTNLTGEEDLYAHGTD